ncbi:MAG: acyltransferase [Armatimonadota bacterium]
MALQTSGRNLKISSNVNIYNPQNMHVGDNVYIGYNCYFGGGDIFLDDEVIIGPFCTIVAGNHTMKNGSYRFGPYSYGTIRIGRGTWLGANSVITSDVSIGKGCLIAAGSVVTKDIPDFTIVGGVPAKPIRKVSHEELTPNCKE